MPAERRGIAGSPAFQSRQPVARLLLGKPKRRISAHGARGQTEGDVMNRLFTISTAAFAMSAAMATTAFAVPVTFGTNWLAQAEHGGYYQAVADGTYAACGLEVTIQQGGPQVAGRPLLLAGKIDFYMGGNMQQAFDAVAQNIPLVVVAASFQKEPQVIMSHPGEGLDKWEDLPKAEQYIIGDEGAQSFLLWMANEYG